MHTFEEISLNLFTGKQLRKEHHSLVEKVMWAKNEVNRVAAEFLIARLLLKSKVNLLLASTDKYSNMLIFITLVVLQYFPPPNNDAVNTELKRLAREGIWSTNFVWFINCR